MKRKSISAEDLKNLLRKMINGALTDNEQMTRLHHIICEEWYGNDFTSIKSVEGIGVESEQSLREEAGDHLSVTLSPKPQEPQINCKNSELHSTICNNDSEKKVTIKELNVQDHKDESPKEEIEVESVKSQKQELNIWHPGNKLSFDEWKERKTAAYKEVLKNHKIEQEQKLNTIKAERERKKRAHAEQEYMRLISLENQRLYNKYVEDIKRAQMKNQEQEMSARRMLNAQAFETWKKRKDDQIREQKKFMWMFENYQKNLEGNRKTVSPVLVEATAKFNSWLNQLNWVLHEKYVRERRHLVRSFYCQPTYYGPS